MNIKPVDEQTQQISDDQELAKVLAGVNEQDEADASASPLNIPPPLPPTPMSSASSDDTTDDAADDDTLLPTPPGPPPLEPLTPPTPMPTPADDPSPAVVDPMLDSIKQQALGELRPLVDKLNVSPEEKFDTYLLLLRSTDDKDLIAPAHEAAKSIADEARKAQALLDIIKEIDFLSQGQ